MMKKEVFKLAANRVGVDTESLRPRTTMSFRTGPTPMAKLKLMHQHYDNRRVLNIALVLMEMQKADDLLRQRDKVQEDYIKTISSGFFDTLKRERRRIRGIKNNRRKIEVVAENENKRLIQSRQEFNERMARAQKRHEELARMRAQQKEYLARRSAERQQEIMRVQVQKEEREAARLKAIQDSHNARNEVLEKHRKAVRCCALLCSAGLCVVVGVEVVGARGFTSVWFVGCHLLCCCCCCCCCCCWFSTNSKRRLASRRKNALRTASCSASASARM